MTPAANTKQPAEKIAFNFNWDNSVVGFGTKSGNGIKIYGKNGDGSINFDDMKLFINKKSKKAGNGFYYTLANVSVKA